LENVPHGLSGPDSFASSGLDTRFLKSTADLGKTISVASDPGEDLLDCRCLLLYWLKPSLTIPLANRYVAISERSTRHHVQRSALSRMLLAAPTPLHDFGTFVFSDNALHLQ
jgi:hypothetical protein